MNPFTLPLYIIGISSGVISALISNRIKYSRIIKVIILLIGASICWVLQIESVEWAYNHPFNPNDGGAKTFVSLFGGIANLIWPILPMFVVIQFLKKLHSKE
jgi:hypothetical protein